MSEETGIITDLKELYGLKDELGKAIKDAIATGNTTKALELRGLIELKIKETERKKDPYQIDYRRDIAREYGYSYVGMFGPEGIARAQLKGVGSDKWVYIKEEGPNISRLNDQVYKHAQPFKEGLARVLLDDNGICFIDPSGEYSSCILNAAEDFSEGLAAVRLMLNCGYLAKDRIFSHPSNGSYCGSFSEGLAPVMVGDNGWVYINRRMKQVTPAVFTYASPFSEGLAMVTVTGNVRYINKNWDTVIAGDYQFTSNFYDGLALVAKDHNYQFINHSGDVVAEGFSEAMSFSEGVANVGIGSKRFFIDREGKTVLDLGEFRAKPFYEGLSRVSRGNQTYYMDHKGSIFVGH